MIVPGTKEFEQVVLCLGVTPQQIHGLREHRFTDEERRFEFFDALDNPAVVWFRTIEQGDERPRINDGAHPGRIP